MVQEVQGLRSAENSVAAALVDAGRLAEHASWIATAARIIRSELRARDVAFWRLNGDSVLRLVNDPFGLDPAAHGPLQSLAVDAAAIDTPSRVVVHGEEVAGSVTAGWSRDRYLSALAELDVETHATVPWTTGSRTLGVVALYDPPCEQQPEHALPALRLAGSLTALIGELKDGEAQHAMVLLRSAERNDQLEEVKRNFLNVAAHELRSPLGILRGYVSMLREQTVPLQDLPRILTLLESKTDEMRVLVDAMLETAAMEESDVRRISDPVDLMEVIEAAAEAMRPLVAPPHRLVLRGARRRLPMRGDRLRLITVFTNIIDNAVKYSPGGGEVTVEWSVDGMHASVQVTDHGVGMRPEDLPGLFGRFSRIVTPDNSHIRGTGLGLYVARETINRHGGEITVESTPGEGSTFSVTLPLDLLPSPQ